MLFCIADFLVCRSICSCMPDSQKSEKCRGYKYNWRNTLRINRAPSWFHLQDYIEMHGQQNLKHAEEFVISGHQLHNLWKVQLTLLPTAKQQAVKRVCKISKITQRERFGTIVFTANRVETECCGSRRLIVNYFFSLSQSMRFMFVQCRGTGNNARFLWRTNAVPSFCALSFRLACGLLEFLFGKSVKYGVQIVNESKVSDAVYQSG